MKSGRLFSVMVGVAVVQTVNDGHPSGERVLVATGNGTVDISEQQAVDLRDALDIWLTAHSVE